MRLLLALVASAILSACSTILPTPGWVHDQFGAITFDRPAAWQVFTTETEDPPWQQRLFFLGTARIGPDCVAVGDVGTCGHAIQPLEDGEEIVQWAVTTPNGSASSVEGTALQVDGRDATWSEPAGAICPDADISFSISVDMADGAGTAQVLDYCARGVEPEIAAATFRQFAASVHL